MRSCFNGLCTWLRLCFLGLCTWLRLFFSACLVDISSSSVRDSEYIIRDRDTSPVLSIAIRLVSRLNRCYFQLIHPMRLSASVCAALGMKGLRFA